MRVGDIVAWERTFTEEDIRLFGRLSGDQGVQHVTPDEQGRLMVQGLLTATLPTKIGGDINFTARKMTFEFHRPVFAGDMIRCQVTITKLEPGGAHMQLSCTFECRNQFDKPVLSGEAHGVIRNALDCHPGQA